MSDDKTVPVRSYPSGVNERTITVQSGGHSWAGLPRDGDGDGWVDFSLSRPQSKRGSDILAVLVDHEGTSLEGRWYELIGWNERHQQFMPVSADPDRWLADVQRNGTRIALWKTLKSASLIEAPRTVWPKGVMQALPQTT